MKATLKFQLPKEKFEFYQASNAWRLAEALQDIREVFRDMDENGERYEIPVGEARKIVNTILSDNGVEFPEI